jgi:glutathione S-transferase
MTVKLYAFPPSPRSFKVLWAANHLGIPFDLHFVDFTRHAQNAPDYLALNPNGRAPTIDDDGYTLWESNAILEYFASLKPEKGMLPAQTRARLSVSKWLYWDSAHWDPACAIFAFERVVKPLFGGGAPVEAEIMRGTALFARIGKVLDGELARHRYVAGDALTIADIALGSPFCIAEEARFPLEDFRNIQRWQADLRALPSWAETMALRLPPAQAQ